MKKIAIVDIETGGFSKQKNGLCEIGMLIILESGEIVSEHSWLIKPYERPEELQEVPNHLVSYKEDAMAINGLTEKQLNDEGIDAAIVVSNFIAKLAEHSICDFMGHNIEKFDKVWIEYFVERFSTNDFWVGMKNTIDTLALARTSMKGMSHKLEDLCAHFGIENKNAHRALGDCHATRELYFKLINNQTQNEKS